MSKPLATVAGVSAGVAAGWLLRTLWQRDDAQNKPAVNNDAAQKKPPVNVRVGVGVGAVGDELELRALEARTRPRRLDCWLGLGLRLG